MIIIIIIIDRSIVVVVVRIAGQLSSMVGNSISYYDVCYVFVFEMHTFARPSKWLLVNLILSLPLRSRLFFFYSRILVAFAKEWKKRPNMIVCVCVFISYHLLPQLEWKYVQCTDRMRLNVRREEKRRKKKNEGKMYMEIHARDREEECT